jgi:ribosomal protein L37E
MKKEIYPKCPSCGKAHDEAIFIKCSSCGFTPETTKRKWKAPNMGKQRSQPKWIAENQKKSPK